jgi:hypothetical protein
MLFIYLFVIYLMELSETNSLYSIEKHCWMIYFFNPILLASCTCTFSKWCKSKKRREEERSIAHLHIQQAQGLVCP